MKKTLIFLAIVLTTFTVNAGQPFKAAKGSKIMIAGTSTLHDWDMESDEFDVQATLNVPEDGSAVTVSQFKLIIPVKTLKSHKSGMDDNAYKALKESDFPTITFDLATASSTSSKVVATGKLTIAGKTREIKTEGELTTLSSGEVKLTGSYVLNMTDYDVEPPSFMFGTVNTGEEITVSYELTLTK